MMMTRSKAVLSKWQIYCAGCELFTADGYARVCKVEG